MPRPTNLLVLFSLLMVSSTAQSSAQGLPQPGAEHQRMAKELVGTWDAVMTAEGRQTKATATYRSICGGMWIASDFEGAVGDIPFQGHGLDGYDPQTKKYVGVWVDSLSTTPMHYTGEYDAATRRLTMSGESPGPDGQPAKFVMVHETKDENHFTFQMSMVGPDGQAQTAFTIDYTRRK